MWDVLIGLTVQKRSDKKIGTIKKVLLEKGEISIEVFYEDNNQEEILAFSDVNLFEKEFKNKINELDMEVLKIIDKKYSLLNFFATLPNKLLKE